MARSIAVSGKGGTGKTTLSAMMVRCLMDKYSKPVLAVDADANACLGITLGLEPDGTIADLRDDVLKQSKQTVGGIGKLEAFGQGCEQLLAESKGFDLLTMGRPEGPRCYCAVNNVLKTFLAKLSGSYGFVLTDNEAGMEHLSRRTTNNVDLLAIVGEPTKIGVITATRIVELINSLPMSIAEVGVIWNRTGKDVDIQIEGAKTLGCVPYDAAVFDLAVEGGTVFELEEDNAALVAVRNILERNFEV